MTDAELEQWERELLEVLRRLEASPVPAGGAAISGGYVRTLKGTKKAPRRARGQV
jgi:hypothetical protein